MQNLLSTQGNFFQVIHSAWLINLQETEGKNGYYYLPDNYAELMVVLEGTFERNVIGTRQRIKLFQGSSYLAPTRTRGVIFSTHEKVSFLLIKVPPYIQHLLSPNGKFETRNDLVSLSGSLFRFQREGIGPDFSATEDFLKQLDANLMTRLCESKIDLVVKCATQLIKAHRGEIKIRELNDQLGVCKSTLEEKFSKAMGLSPKEFCKVEKLNNFLMNYRIHQANMNLTQLTFKCGYYDQSHLIKEFQYFADISPRKYLKEVNKLEPQC